MSTHAFHELYENAHNPGCYCYKDIPPSGIFTIQLSRTQEPIFIDFVPYLVNGTPSLLNTSLSLEEDRKIVANQLIEKLENSIWKRISTIDCMSSSPQYVFNFIMNSICIMFSGGIDCSIIACLLCHILQKHHLSWVIELANIAYGDKIEEREVESLASIAQVFPDRYTACTPF